MYSKIRQLLVCLWTVNAPSGPFCGPAPAARRGSGRCFPREECTTALCTRRVVCAFPRSQTLLHTRTLQNTLRALGAGRASLESAIDNRPPSNIGRACVTTKEAKRKIITASERYISRRGLGFQKNLALVLSTSDVMIDVSERPMYPALRHRRMGKANSHGYLLLSGKIDKRLE